MRKIIFGAVAAFLAAVLLFPAPVYALSAEKAIVVDAATGRILYEKKPDERSLIASTTKIMTALVVSEQCNVLDRMRIPAEAVGIEGSSMYLTEGEVLTIQELLYGLMLRSGNDAAVALAIYCGGTVEGFVNQMNDKARSLGLTGTHFENPNGLDHPNHYSTARDLAVLSAYAMKNPIFAQTVKTKQVKSGKRILQNHNKLLWSLPGAEGVKTGYTRAAGRILVSSTAREGRRLIAVTINAPDDWNDHKTLVDNGFSNFQMEQIIKENAILGTVPVFGGKEKEVSVISDESFCYPLAQGESAQIVLPEPGFAYAPISSGQNAGFAFICIDDAVVGKISVHYGATIEQQENQSRHFWDGWFGERKA